MAGLLLDALGRHFTEDAWTAAPAMRRALASFMRADLATDEEFRWWWAAHTIAVALWDENAGRELADRHVRLAREHGALALLPRALTARVIMLAFEGELDEAASVHEEIRTLAMTGPAIGAPVTIGSAIGSLVTTGSAVGALALAAWRGRQDEAEQLADTLISEAESGGEGSVVPVAEWLRAVLHNGLGRHEEARTAAARACAYHPAPGAAAHWAPAELVEAAIHSGDRELAARALDRLVQATRASGTDWALGVEARSRALLGEGEDAEDHHREAIDRLRRTRMRADLARSHLGYGTWLRAEGRDPEAREQLRTASQLFTAMGMAGFAGRAERELLAAGERARKAPAATAAELTPQETRVVKLARDGLTNKEIAGLLYVSPRTVEYHLGKVFAKLGITSRNQLQGVS